MDRAVLTIRIDANAMVHDASISLPNDFYKYSEMKLGTVEEVIASSVGNSWHQLVTDVLYFIYSQNRFYSEVESFKARYNVDTSQEGVLRIGFPNFVVISIRVPKNYPRVRDVDGGEA